MISNWSFKAGSFLSKIPVKIESFFPLCLVLGMREIGSLFSWEERLGFIIRVKGWWGSFYFLSRWYIYFGGFGFGGSESRDNEIY